MTVYGSVCSGIEAASVAWQPLGWRCAWLSEIESFPCRVLAERWPLAPNLGDMLTLAARVRAGEVEAPDVLIGGTPCQAFSCAGLRGGLADARGNLALAYVELVNAIDEVRIAASQRPCYALWENVPGVLSAKDNAFGCILAGLAGADAPIVPEGKWSRAGLVAGPQRTVAWRTLDAQFFGVAQRRRRVFVLAHGGPGAWRSAAALLPIGESVSGNPPSRSQARQDVAGTLAAHTSAGGGLGTDFDLAGGLQASDGGVDENDAEQGRLVAHSLRAEGFDASEDGSGRGTPLVTAFDTTQITHPENRCNPQPGDPCHPLAAGAHPPAVAFSIVPESGQGADLRASEIDIAPALTTEEAKMHDRGTRIASASAVRRLLPVECARLQGFPDDYLDLPGGADGAKYRALGNSMAVPVISWLGKRIGAVIEP